VGGFLGHGVGLRVPHYERALAGELDVDWIEVISENFFGGGGRPRAVLDRVRRDLPLVMHGVSLGIGSADPPSPRYLQQLKELADRYEPAWLSDHLCWGHVAGVFSHDLLPLPYTEQALRHVVDQLGRVQEALQRPLLLENVSSYVSFARSELTEWEFLSEVARRSGCSILLDLNNILVSAHNHGFAPEQYLAGVPGERVRQLHLANHSTRPTHKFDDHRGPVPEEVWQLAEAAWRRFGPVASSIEWDEEVPSWEVLRAEQREATRRAAAALAGAARGGAPVPSACLAAADVAAGTSLRAVQELFLDAIRWPTGVAGFLESAGDERRRAIQHTFEGSGRFGVVERLEVYAGSYFYRLLAALRELFPRLCFLYGEVGFHNLVTDYVLACPSREPDLRRVGERLPEFIRRHEDGSLLFGETAALELALGTALDARDATPLSEGDLSTIPPEHWPELRFRWAPSTQLIQARCELERLEHCYLAQDRQAALEIEPGDERALVVGRRGHATYFRALGRGEASAFEALWHGENFAVACAEVERAGEQPAELVPWLRRWLADGMLASIDRG
jgi:uncharacterized protein (UPF0276 family)